MKQIIYCWFAIVILIYLNGCATSSVFSPYPLQINEIKQGIEKRSFKNSLKTLDKQRDGQDKTLYMLERGRVNQLNGDVDSSIKDFALSMRAEAVADDRAKISASETAAKGAALVSNDNAIPYRAAGYERVMMHHYQAINYLMKNDLEGAGVEVRRAALEQREGLERHHKEIAEAEKKAKDKKYNPSGHNAQINRRFSAMYAAAGGVKNSFQNAYTFYLSGVIYEMLGEPNDAYIDYKKALEIFPNNQVLQKDVLRLSKQLGFVEDYEVFSQKFKSEAVGPSANEGELIVLYEEGYVPVKEQIGIPLAARRAIHTVAFPIYRDLNRRTGKLSLSNNSGLLASTALICDFSALAIKDLEEKMTGILIRQVLRLFAKDGVRKVADDQLGPAGAIAAILFNVISEQADRRSWLTLPRNSQVSRIRLPIGKQTITLKAANGEMAEVSVDIKQNKLTVLHAVGTRKQLYARVL